MLGGVQAKRLAQQRSMQLLLGCHDDIAETLATSLTRRSRCNSLAPHLPRACARCGSVRGCGTPGIC